MKRHSAFLINGGAGRIICSIPALELYERENPEDDFIIVVEYGIDFFKGHPTLYKRCYDFAHKNLFMDKIKDRDFYFPEPYHVWEYYNQQASISQAFDILINNKGLRELPNPTINLTNEESFGGTETVANVKKDNSNKKIIVFQLVGRGSNMSKEQTTLDPFGKSFYVEEAVTIIKRLQKKYTVIVMSENQIDFTQLGCEQQVPQILGISLRKWMGIINAADYFLGCDSVGQHIAYALNKRATVVLGSTFPENVSYPKCKNFDILDFGKDRRMYSPLRISFDEVADSTNEKLMRLSSNDIDTIVDSVERNINK
jgi:hypothetical protein